MREETLRAIISARETLSKDMRNAAEGTRELRQAMAESALSSSEFVGAMAVTEEQTESLEQTLETLQRDAESTAASQHILAEGIDAAGDAALESAVLMDLYEGRVEEAGEEARETTMENMGLAASMQAVAAAAGEASVNIGPFNTNVRRAVIALPALIALVGSLATVLTGLSVAALAAGGALIALFAGGMVGAAEDLESASADIESRMEALEQIFTNVGSAIDQVTEPIQGLAMQQAALDALGGLVMIIGDLANSAERLMPIFSEVHAALAPTFWAEEAKGVAELEKMIIDLMPLLERMAFYIFTELPDLIAWLREETERVGPAMGDFATSLIPVVRELSEFGGTIFNLTLPALSLLLDGVAILLDLINAVPEPVAAAIVAFGALSAALVMANTTITLSTISVSALTSAVWGLATAVWGGLFGPITASIAIIAGLAAAVVGIITYFEWWGDIIDGLVWAWNGLIEVIEFSINAIVASANKIDEWVGVWLLAFPVLNHMIWLIANFGEIMEWVGNVIDEAREKWEAFVRAVRKWAGPLADAIGGMANEVDQAGGVSLEGAKLEQGGGPGASRAEAERRADSDGSQAASERAQDFRGQKEEYNFDFSGSSFGDQSQRDIEKAVEEALERHRRKTSDR